MKITLITVGKLKSAGGFKEIDDFYRSRISVYSKLEVVELKEKNDINSETESIIKSIPSGSYIIALREEGTTFDSMRFSKLLLEKNESYGHISFIIGGAYGYSAVNEHMALSIAPWTLPHQLARINILEQIYRGLSIIKGSGYHHG
ncbi:MAG TPA: 23S rRNA (pseudouridine(1915)-N(3))-methyltransferase RlmH [bacterium]|nr:23S rRNA (pseudouridine(1915)-N(3))-methyltransferase RlmH [bacterium]HPS29418.1 23S rRNA (pseudouridine(1915)-N(3))-methyltransferase RlmH [bacterium]